MSHTAICPHHLGSAFSRTTTVTNKNTTYVHLHVSCSANRQGPHGNLSASATCPAPDRYDIQSEACSVGCWHDLDNSEYDCWPLDNPNEYNMINCGGLEMAWLVRPPETVKSGHMFSVTYSVKARGSFYQWAVDNHVFTHSSNPEEAQEFCELQECPANWKDANTENCCIHHANIHSCPLGYMTAESICGPWIPDDGKIFTHTISTSGKMSQTNWTSKVVLVHPGLTSLIAHIRVGLMQAALEAKSTVLPAVVCGDGDCEEAELCSTCPADCGDCPLTSWNKLAIGLPLSSLCLCIILAVVWLRYQKQKLLWDESWIIDFTLLKQDHEAGWTTSSIVSVLAAHSDGNTSGVTALGSYAGQAGSRKTPFTSTGIYDGQMVAIKRIQTKTFCLSKTIRQEVKQVRELDHPNLCKFVGGCVEVPNVAIVTEYCPKGSLNDVLLNEEVPLNWGFRFSFAMDIARGMAYLHQHRVCHGRLTSLNCVLDDRWVCKITDYGLRIYCTDDGMEPLSTYQQRLMAVYLPPEFQSCNVEPTLAGDVFSYSIILLEIATRSDPAPVEESSLECSWCPPLPELISSRADSTCPCPADYVELIRRCRSHNPAHRPTFEQIRKFVHRINPVKVSPVDMMMNLMEKYSKHLEVLVAERTQDLTLEKQKTDRLLYSMLPKQVADDLRHGKPLQAQSYVSATVFFSDIVGFTQLSSSSTPYQVVDFLNKLYTTFDDIIDNYDVYKVETIGDAYMVVSGVPRENGILHASQIASMALDLVGICHTFRIPHKPNMQLQIRAGIHSGPVVAGVVGTKMPRYCLFGDTVNTASRMESTSLALKIQCSSGAFYLLEEIGGYVLTCRGTLQVKGKGDMVTYWLDSKKTGMMAKPVTTETEGEQDSSIPGCLDPDPQASKDYK
ncbi:atrial natriuretic peptide receptor 1-like [Thalassophryne amazonica]|uniref:atrial natriuretic peptide receptor 1-like n=1 Tax=Thalassophryne amazonica TaxID=390379 RepID=UPI0014712F98|nr:atrial natriuretic peptide receptor 1-like [Thalassophryne amazonica]